MTRKFRHTSRKSQNIMTRIADNLANVKSDINKLDIGKIETTAVDLSKLRDVINRHVVKKDLMNWLKTLMLFRLLIPVIYLKRLTMTKKLMKLKKNT